MGFFSELNIRIEACKSSKNYETLDALRSYRAFLSDRLIELESLLPCDSLDPMYDRYYYSDHVEEIGELPTTVQGTAKLIRRIDGKIAKLEVSAQNHVDFLSAIMETDAAPNGQLVLSAGVFPLEEIWTPVA